MVSLRGLVGAASLGVMAVWSACGGVAEPGALSDTSGLDPDGEAGQPPVTGNGSGGERGDAEPAGAGGTTGTGTMGGAANDERMDPDIGLGNGGGANAGNGGTLGLGGESGTEADGGSGGTVGEDPDGGIDAEVAGGGGAEVVGGGGAEVVGGGGAEVVGGTEVIGAGGSAGSAPVGQGGATQPPPIVDVEVGDCEDFVACGGELEGTWTYTGACVDLADLGLAEDDIADLCPGAELSIEGQVSGTLRFEDGLVTRNGASSARGEVFVPAACAVVSGGCDAVEDELEVAGLAGANCVSQGFFSPCNCVFEIEAPELDEVAFITDGDVLSLSDGRDFQYCVDGADLTYVEIGGVSEPGVRQLAR